MRLGTSLRSEELLLPLGAGAAAVVLGVLAGIDPRLGIGAAVGLAFVGIVLVNLFTGFAVMVLFAYMETLSTLQGLSLAKIAGVVIVGSWIALLTSGQRGVRDILSERPGLVYLLMAFLGWAAISILWSEDRGEAVASVTRYALNAVLIPIAYTAIRDRRDAVRLFGVLVAGAGVAAVSGIVDAPSASQYDVARASGTAGDPNELAAALVVGFWVAAAFVVNRHVDPRGRLASLVVAVLCLLAIAASLSRGGLLAMGVAGLVAVVVGGRWRARIVTGVSLVGLTAIGYFLVIASSDARDRVLHSGGGSGRVDLWTIGFRMIEDHPLRGIGTGQYITSSVHYLLRPGAFQRGDLILSAPKIAHNTYLGTVAELGIVGGLIFGAIVVVCGRSAWQAVKQFQADGDESLEILMRGFFIGAVGYAASLVFISENYKKVMWVVIFALGPVMLAVARAGHRAPGAAEAPALEPAPAPRLSDAWPGAGGSRGRPAEAPR
ncbi:MAG TPA: O-antigen ligase family protein [Baekduia sp.]|nr:O-antigen ligase family protein [Baekduia sp.]